MKQPDQWTEDDIQTLIREQTPEDLQLEYKRSASLENTDARRTEISKDVSAMANSAGGTIIYGIDEKKSTNGPITLDPVNPSAISLEWLEQVIDSNIQRRIEGLRVHAVPIGGGKVYVVSVPQSNRAPHMAKDKRFHKRRETTTAQMEEYEIRDVGRRQESPDLYLNVTASKDLLEPMIGNRATEPLMYATCRLYMEQKVGVPIMPDFQWARHEDVPMLWNGERQMFQVFHQTWSADRTHPILEGEEYSLGTLPINLSPNLRTEAALRPLMIGWELRAPKMERRLCGLRLIVDSDGTRIASQSTTLEAVP